jgi:hypothetical protein
MNAQLLSEFVFTLYAVIKEQIFQSFKVSTENTKSAVKYCSAAV